MDTTMKRRDRVLDLARNLINHDRADEHGDAHDNHEEIGRRWGAVLGTAPVPPHTVTRMMAELKMARMRQTRSLDNYVDAIGYLALSAELDPDL